MKRGMCATLAAYALATAMAGTASADAAPIPPLALPPVVVPAPVEKYPFRAFAEVAALLGGGAVWYWWDADFNAPDWALAWDRPSWKRKLITFDAVRFDDNIFDTNARSHPRAGIGYYLVGRGNNLSMGESLALSTVSSVVWEYLIEFREKPSINDMVLTPASGLAIGEPFYQFGLFFQRASDSLIHNTLGTALTPIASLNDYLADRTTVPAEDLDAAGLPADNVHRFDLGAGLASSIFDGKDRRSESDFKVEGELNNIRGYTRPGAFRRHVGGGDVNQLALRLALEGSDPVKFDIGSRVSFWGGARQDLREVGPRRLEGWANWWALGSAFEYSMRSRPGAPRDELVIANLIGVMSEFLIPHGPWRFRLRTQAFVNFGMIHSLAFERAKGTMDLHGAKTVLLERGYYYAYGGTGSSQLVARYKAFELTVEGRIDRFRSIQGHDSAQELVTNDFALFDRRTRARGWFALRPQKGLAEFAVEVEWLRRTGTLPGVLETMYERRGMLSLSLVWN